MEKTIQRLNPWWDTGIVPQAKLGSFRRDAYGALEKSLGGRKVTSLIGPRQVGKTTLVYQLIDGLIRSGTDPRRILYLNFDKSTLRLESEGRLDNCLEFFEAYVVREELTKLTRPAYVFLDEVQKLQGWGDELKHWQDLGLDIKFMISGSSALRIVVGSGESLLGRIDHHILLPLQFRELARVKKGVAGGNGLGFDELKETERRLMLKKNELQMLLREYLIKGGYPEVLDKELEDAYKILNDYKTLTFKKDLFDLVEIRDSSTLDDLITLLAYAATNRTNYEQLASTTKVTIEKVKRYISLFENIFLVKLAYLKHGNAPISVRKERKCYFVDTGMRNAVVGLTDLKGEEGALIENVVFSATLPGLFRTAIDPKCFYWQDKSKHEVDIILVEKGKQVPIEVKYRNTISDKDLTGILRFMEQSGTEQGIVVTKDLLEKRKAGKGELLFVPAWLFLLCKN